jgi:hypothetical protein
MTVMVELRDETRALIDKARGNQDVADFLAAAGEQLAKRRLSRRAAPAELTAADHIRMADAGEATAHSLEESRRRVFARIDALEAEAARR